MNKVVKLVKNTEVVDSKGASDTVRVWENYREQAILWRALTLLQIPLTLTALIFCMVLWYTRSNVINVPAKPLPGIYPAYEIPDTEFINAATEFVNLVASYQPVIARRQFSEARNMLVEPLLSTFDVEMMGDELKTIETTGRTQLFFVDPSQTTISRQDRSVTVTFIGERLKLIAGRELPAIQSTFIVELAINPRNKLNPYGIVIKNASLKNFER